MQCYRCQPRACWRLVFHSLLSCRDKGLEQRLELAGPPEVLRMPLDTQAEARDGLLDGFDDPVGCGCGDHESLSQPANRLMVATVDAAGSGGGDRRSQSLVQARSGRDAHFVGNRVPRRRDRVLQVGLDRRRYVLDQRSHSAPVRPGRWLAAANRPPSRAWRDRSRTRLARAPRPRPTRAFPRRRALDRHPLRPSARRH